MRLVVFFATSLAVLRAQTAAPSAVAEIKQDYNGIKTNLLRSAEKMPEENYSFKPSPEVRSFGEEVAHAADIQTMFCSMALNKPAQGTAAQKKTKAELVAALQESNALCDQAYASLTEANANESRSFLRGPRSLLGVLQFNVSHDNETYGTMVPYMRMKGIVPPSSDAPAGGAGRGGKKQ